MRRVWIGLSALALMPCGVAAQGRALELQVGRWDAGTGFTTYAGMFTTSLIGPIGIAYGGLAIVGDSLDGEQSYFAANVDLSVFRFQSRVGVYGIVGAALGVYPFETIPEGVDSSRFAVSWSIGAGLEWNPLAFAGLGAQIRYRVQDRGVRGFWNTDGTALRHVELAIGGTVRWGYRRTPRPRAATPVNRPESITGAAADVVETALTAMGTPYEWGGTDENGFDCSGLIQWAYAQHGYVVPRVSRDQARTGHSVSRTIDALRPGDILAFSAVPGGQITHVGMYVGDSTFIHSSTRGVTLSRLSPSDPNGKWWWQRWRATRRVA